MSNVIMSISFMCRDAGAWGTCSGRNNQAVKRKEKLPENILLSFSDFLN